MENKPVKPIPSSKERLDLYDGFDGIERPEGWENPVKLPPELQGMIEKRKQQQESNK